MGGRRGVVAALGQHDCSALMRMDFSLEDARVCSRSGRYKLLPHGGYTGLKMLHHPNGRYGGTGARSA